MDNIFKAATKKEIKQRRVTRKQQLIDNLVTTLNEYEYDEIDDIRLIPVKMLWESLSETTFKLLITNPLSVTSLKCAKDGKILTLSLTAKNN